MRTEILEVANDSTAEVELPLESIADKTVGDIASKDLRTRSHPTNF